MLESTLQAISTIQLLGAEKKWEEPQANHKAACHNHLIVSYATDSTLLKLQLSALVTSILTISRVTRMICNPDLEVTNALLLHIWYHVHGWPTVTSNCPKVIKRLPVKYSCLRGTSAVQGLQGMNVSGVQMP